MLAQLNKTISQKMLEYPTAVLKADHRDHFLSRWIKKAHRNISLKALLTLGSCGCNVPVGESAPPAG